MNGERLQQIIEEVISRLRQRAESAIALSVAQLREADSRTLFCQYSTLRVLQVDLPLLEHIAQYDTSDETAAILHEALAFGLCVQLSVQRRLLPTLPVKKLARLPLAFSDELGQSIILHPARLLSYADIACLTCGAVVLRRNCVVTAMAREAAGLRNLQLIKQE